MWRHLQFPMQSSLYPQSPSERDRWILAQRLRAAPRETLDPLLPQAFLVEDECDENGEVVPVATIFLTNRECPWRCLMCDLWRHTLTESVPRGAIGAQIDYALKQLPPARHIKLYNSGSFFDERAIPSADYPEIASRLAGFERVIVESHPLLIGEKTLCFRDLLQGKLEVAMGLETVHPVVGPQLNKRVSLDQWKNAAACLSANDIALRAFVLVKPPFLDEDEALFWAARSTEWAFEHRAQVVALIPTRDGNGAMEALAEAGEWSPPRLETLEAAFDFGLNLQQGRVLADVWDLQRFSSCAHCFEKRQARLAWMNLRQTVAPRIECEWCAAA
jgi:radical SAM enzyme (TIGR01210 family)